MSATRMSQLSRCLQVVLLCCALIEPWQVAAFSSTFVPSSARRSAALQTRSLNNYVGAAGQASASRSQRRRNTLVCRVQAPRAFDCDDWFENMQNLPKSKLLGSIKSHLLFNTAWAGMISLVHELTPQHLIDDLHISTVPHSVMSSALGLLLVFRSNASYGRWWEARKIWGSVTNTVRNIARLAHSSMGHEARTYGPFIEYVKAFPWMLKQHLQDVRDDEEVAWLNLPPDEFERLQSNPNPAMFACERMTQLIRETYGVNSNSVMFQGNSNTDLAASGQGQRVREDPHSVFYRNLLEQEIDKLVDALGMCERILGTPVPRSYSRHTSRFLTVYLATLPIVLVPHTEWFTAPCVAIICWGLLSIEAIAYYIEQPFDAQRAQLPLATYCGRMRVDIGRVATPEPLPEQWTDGQIPHPSALLRDSAAPAPALQAAAPAAPVQELASASEPVSHSPAAEAAGPTVNGIDVSTPVMEYNSAEHLADDAEAAEQPHVNGYAAQEVDTSEGAADAPIVGYPTVVNGHAVSNDKEAEEAAKKPTPVGYPTRV